MIKAFASDKDVMRDNFAQQLDLIKNHKFIQSVELKNEKLLEY